MYPDGKEKDIDLSLMIEAPSADRVKVSFHFLQLFLSIIQQTTYFQVTSEQYDLYCEMGTTFELCKICDDRDKNVRIEPCGHLMCGPCLQSWQVSCLHVGLLFVLTAILTNCLLYVFCLIL